MKKSVNSKAPTKYLNVMKNYQGDCEKNEEIHITESDCMIESQTQYIDNLQQQIFVLENEVGYLTYLHESNKQHPSILAEGEKMVKKLGDYHNEVKTMKIELKKKQTNIDVLRSERDRVHRYKEELEEKFRKEKCKLLEEIITLRKEKESYQDKYDEIKATLLELKQNERNLQEEIDNLRVEMEMSQKENLADKEFILSLSEAKEKLQKDVYELKMTREAGPSEVGSEAMKALKEKIQELDSVCETCKQKAQHEHLLRERLAQDNAALIKKHSELEADLAEARASLREEQSLRSSLEKVHLSTVVEASEVKNKEKSLKDENTHLNSLLKAECDHSMSLSLQLSNEQRLKAREAEKFSHLMQRFNQREEQAKMRENENIELLRDNTYLRDQVLNLKEQLKNRDDEIVTLKHKVQEMQVSVEEFIQSSQAAKRLDGVRWKQLSQLAQGITALTSNIEGDT